MRIDHDQGEREGLIGRAGAYLTRRSGVIGASCSHDLVVLACYAYAQMGAVRIIYPLAASRRRPPRGYSTISQTLRYTRPGSLFGEQQPIPNHP